MSLHDQLCLRSWRRNSQKILGKQKRHNVNTCGKYPKTDSLLISRDSTINVSGSASPDARHACWNTFICQVFSPGVLEKHHKEQFFFALPLSQQTRNETIQSASRRSTKGKKNHEDFARIKMCLASLGYLFARRSWFRTFEHRGEQTCKQNGLIRAISLWTLSTLKGCCDILNQVAISQL